jgi:hypothetical protein
MGGETEADACEGETGSGGGCRLLPLEEAVVISPRSVIVTCEEKEFCLSHE